jgi:uncharacterized protein
MPTNILRKKSETPRPSPRAARARNGPRIAVLTAGRVSIRIELSATPTADLVWNALPLHSTAETWGASINFETPLEAGRDRSARVLASAGEIYFWAENNRIVVPFGPTPISRPGEIRLPSPCNVWARALDDVKALAVVTPGEKISLVATASALPA